MVALFHHTTSSSEQHVQLRLVGAILSKNQELVLALRQHLPAIHAQAPDIFHAFLTWCKTQGSPESDGVMLMLYNATNTQDAIPAIVEKISRENPFLQETPPTPPDECETGSIEWVPEPQFRAHKWAAIATIEYYIENDLTNEASTFAQCLASYYPLCQHTLAVAKIAQCLASYYPLCQHTLAVAQMATSTAYKNALKSMVEDPGNATHKANAKDAKAAFFSIRHLAAKKTELDAKFSNRTDAPPAADKIPTLEEASENVQYDCWATHTNGNLQMVPYALWSISQLAVHIEIEPKKYDSWLLLLEKSAIPEEKNYTLKHKGPWPCCI